MKRTKEEWIAWAKAAGKRALRTFAQALIGSIGAAKLISDVNWEVAFSAAALSALVSVLTSIKGLPEEKTTTTSELTE